MDYDERVLNFAKTIIKDKNIELLSAILKNYDMLVKMKGNIKNTEYPYWELCCFFGD